MWNCGRGRTAVLSAMPRSSNPRAGCDFGGWSWRGFDSCARRPSSRNSSGGISRSPEPDGRRVGQQICRAGGTQSRRARRFHRDHPISRHHIDRRVGCCFLSPSKWARTSYCAGDASWRSGGSRRFRRQRRVHRSNYCVARPATMHRCAGNRCAEVRSQHDRR